MIIPQPKEVFHKSQIYRLLMAIIDDKTLSNSIAFKGGTCAAMLGYLDRFSIDLDFDKTTVGSDKKILSRLKDIFSALEFQVKEKSPATLLFVLQYQAPKFQRNTLKLSLIDNPVKTNRYEIAYLPEIDRYCRCQTKETMFANKLVSLTDRYKKYRAVAGRDVYDINHFFRLGFRYEEAIIKERTGREPLTYLKTAVRFIKEKVNQKIINQDLNYLLTPKKFSLIRKTLKAEVLMALTDEIKRLE